MTEQPSLDAIDFSHPIGEFIFKEQSYQIKRYFKKYFFRNKDYSNYEYIYCFRSSQLAKEIVRQRHSTQVIEQLLYEQPTITQRCVHYENIIFCFGNVGGGFFSLKHRYWKPFRWKAPRHINTDVLLYNPYQFFNEHAKIVYQNEVPVAEGDLSLSTYISHTEKPLEFMCGSEAELKRLTRLAAITLPEFQALFKFSSYLIIKYNSDTNYQFGGVFSCLARNCQQHVFSKSALKLFALIFD